MKIFLTYATYSAFASEESYFPLAPVYLFTDTPWLINPAFVMSETSAYSGSIAASTSADNILELQNTSSSKFGLLALNLFKSSAINVSNTCDCIPVFPMLPVSSLSENKHTAVLSGFSMLNIALNDEYTHDLSS